MFKRPLFSLALLALMTFPLNSTSGQQKPGDDQADTRTQFIVGPRATLMPVGVFILVKKDKSVGAIRFTSIEHGSEFGTGKATYESYFQADSTKSFVDKSVVKKSGIIDLRPLTGIGRFAFQTGNDRVDIGPWSFSSSFPGNLDMWPYRGDSQDYGYEFAPTSAQSVAEINISDSRLRWFRFDPDASITLKVSEMPN
jgi:hypothetical protein